MPCKQSLPKIGNWKDVTKKESGPEPTANAAVRHGTVSEARSIR